jgi:hypothetical protein
VAQLRVILPNSCKHGFAATWSIKLERFLTSLRTIGFSRQSLNHGASGSKVHISLPPLCNNDMQLRIIFLYSRSQPKDDLAQLKHVAEWILTNKCCVIVPYMMQNSTFRALSTK